MGQDDMEGSVPEKLLVSQEGLCSVELVNYSAACSECTKHYSGASCFESRLHYRPFCFVVPQYR